LGISGFHIDSFDREIKLEMYMTIIYNRVS